MDTLADTSPEDFATYERAFADIAAGVHDASPETQVFPVFQLEKITGHRGGLFGGDESATPRWDLLDAFANADAVGFTTYPGLVFRDPADIPADYYRTIRDHTDLPVLVTEMGWFTADDITGWNSSPQEQREFVQRLPALLADLDPQVVIWSFLYDQPIQRPFDTMGLFDDTGAPRPAWDVWKELTW